MTNAAFTAFDYNYHQSQKHFDMRTYEEYVRHNVDVYNKILFKDCEFQAVYQTGMTYRNNNLSCPSARLGLSEDGGTDKLLIKIDRLTEKDLEDLDFIEELNFDCIKTIEDLHALKSLIEENKVNANDFLEALEIDPVFLDEEN